MKRQQDKGAESKESQENIKPGSISLWYFDYRDKAIQEPRGEEEIRKNPNMVVENDTKQIEKQSHNNNANQDHQQNQRNPPKSIFHSKRPNWE